MIRALVCKTSATRANRREVQAREDERGSGGRRATLDGAAAETFGPP
jgi:hypothetical protein